MWLQVKAPATQMHSADGVCQLQIFVIIKSQQSFVCLAAVLLWLTGAFRVIVSLKRDVRPLHLDNGSFWFFFYVISFLCRCHFDWEDCAGGLTLASEKCRNVTMLKIFSVASSFVLIWLMKLMQCYLSHIKISSLKRHYSSCRCENEALVVTLYFTGS